MKLRKAALELYARAGLKCMHNMYHVKVCSEALEALSLNDSPPHIPFLAQPTWSQADWDYVERRYPMMEGMLNTLAGKVFIPIKMTRSDAICGFCILGAEDNMLWRLAVDKDEDTIPFMVAVSKMFPSRTECVPLWLEKESEVCRVHP